MLVFDLPSFPRSSSALFPKPREMGEKGNEAIFKHKSRRAFSDILSTHPN